MFFKKYFLTHIIILFLFVSTTITAQQNSYSQGEIIKIQLNEKFNLPAKELPVLLIKAYCEGLIQGFFPLRVDSICSFYEFQNQFAFGQIPYFATEEFLKRVNTPQCCPYNIPKCPNHCFPQEIICPQNYCDYSNASKIDNFKQNYDIIQQKRFDKNTSKEVYDIKYIRIVYSYEKYGQKFNMLGPVFNYQDVIALNRDDFKIMNTKNDAVFFTFKQYFENRMFHATVTKTSLIDSKKPDAVEQREKDNWDN